MKISSEHVGACCTPLDVEVTTRKCVNYAASIGNENPWHIDDTRENGIVAPPMLAIALTWRISERFTDFWNAADFPYEVLTRQVHYSERIQWNRVMRPGEKLRIEGRVDAILPHRAGTHLIIVYTAYDKENQIVFTEHIGGLLRGVVCEDAGKGQDCVTEHTIPKDNTPLWEQTHHISRLAAHIYDGCADVHFPIHISPAFAQSVGLPGIIFQGTGTLALAVKEIAAVEAENNPCRIAGVQCRFTGMVRPGSDISIQLLHREPVEDQTKCYFTVADAKGKTVIRDGCVDIAPE